MKYFLPLIVLLAIACKNDPKNKSQLEKPSEEKMEFTQEKTTYYFIRHTEKDVSDPHKADPHLTQNGLERAAFWAKYFADKNIDLIYSTKYSRTIQTAIPTLDTLNLDLNIYEGFKLYTPEFLRETNGKTVLIVGHQNSLPDLINKILGEEKYPNIPADEYGYLYTIEIGEDGSRTTFKEEIPMENHNS